MPHPTRSLLVLATVAVSWLPLAAQVVESSSKEQETAARLLGVAAERLASVEVSAKRFHALGLDVTMVKAEDRTSGDVISTIVDASGNSYDLPALLTAEKAARRSSPLLKIDRELARAMERSETALLPAIAWLDYDGDTLDGFIAATRNAVDPRTLDLDARRQLEARLTDFAVASNGAVVGPFADLLRSRGLKVRSVSTTAPVVFFDATPAALRELAELPAVDTLYLETADKSDHNVDANATHRTDRVHEYGIRGRGTRVAMLEDNGIDPACPHLVVSAWFNAGTPDPDNHIHGSSGCVASRLASRIGSAPDVELYSANATTYSDSDVTAAGDWIAGQNIDITNMSFGPTVPTGNLRYLDRYIDYQSRAFQDSYVASAGNSNIGSFVGNVGWNMIVVGSHTDNDEGDWTGDVMSGFSSTANPSTGCEKPNLAANGQDVDTLGQGPGWLTNDYDGTSFSAPHASGNLANALTVDATLALYPEAAMAAIMASAWHNIEGVSRLSDQDGAGGLHGLALARLALDGRAFGASLTPASFTATGYYTYSIYLQGGDRTRVCLGWLSNANSAYTTDTLQADLDITVLAGQNVTSGTSYGSSASFNNNFELVEFTPPTTGWYTVRVNDFRFDGASEGIGIAWSQKYEDTSHFRLRPWSSETSFKTGPTIGNQSYYLDPVAPTSPSAPFVCLPSGTITTGFTFSAQTFSPLDFDIWTQLFFDTLPAPLFWFGPVGTLSASGTYFGNRFSVPDAPFLLGLTLYHVGFTGDPAYPDGLKEISEVNALKFWPNPVAKTLSDDGSFVQALPFGFRFYGVDYTECHVNANGNLTFGGADTDFTESAAELLANRPRIAFLWDDLNPAATGSQGAGLTRVREVFVGAQELVIEFINLTQFSLTDASTVRVTLRDDNSITVEYLDCDLTDAIVGISPGNGVSAATEKDLSSSGELLSGTNQALFEQFSGGADSFDLGSPNIYFNQLRFVPTSASATNYRLKLDLSR